VSSCDSTLPRRMTSHWSPLCSVSAATSHCSTVQTSCSSGSAQRSAQALRQPYPA
jgi:hypothetical protein